METLASKGIMCVLVEMPFRLAVFDMDAAEGIQKQYPEVEKWYIGGHSLGDSMAASYLSKCEKSFEEVVIDGGCHAYFGMYRVQKGDGLPDISNEEQIKITVDSIVKIVEE